MILKFKYKYINDHLMIFVTEIRESGYLHAKCSPDRVEKKRRPEIF